MSLNVELQPLLKTVVTQFAHIKTTFGETRWPKCVDNMKEILQAHSQITEKVATFNVTHYEKAMVQLIYQVLDSLTTLSDNFLTLATLCENAQGGSISSEMLITAISPINDVVKTNVGKINKTTQAVDAVIAESTPLDVDDVFAAQFVALEENVKQTKLSILSGDASAAAKPFASVKNFVMGLETTGDGSPFDGTTKEEVMTDLRSVIEQLVACRSNRQFIAKMNFVSKVNSFMQSLVVLLSPLYSKSPTEHREQVSDNSKKHEVDIKETEMTESDKSEKSEISEKETNTIDVEKKEPDKQRTDRATIGVHLNEPLKKTYSARRDAIISKNAIRPAFNTPEGTDSQPKAGSTARTGKGHERKLSASEAENVKTPTPKFPRQLKQQDSKNQILSRSIQDQKGKLTTQTSTLSRSDVIKRKAGQKTGNFMSTLKRTKKNEMNTSQRLDSQFMRKQLEIDKSARSICDLLYEGDTKNLEKDISESLDNLIISLDIENMEDNADKSDLIDSLNLNTISLLKTSTKFRITKRVMPVGEMVKEDQSPDERKRSENYEKAGIKRLVERCADIAAMTEDLMCFGCLLLANPKDNDFLAEIESLSKHISVVAMEYVQNTIDMANMLIGLKADEKMIKEFETSLKDSMDTIIIMKKTITTYSFKPVLDDNMIDVAKGIGIQIKPGDMEQYSFELGTKMRAVVSQLIAITAAICANQVKTQVNKDPNRDRKVIIEDSDVDMSIMFTPVRLQLLEAASTVYGLIILLNQYLNHIATASYAWKIQRDQSMQVQQQPKIPFYEEINATHSNPSIVRQKGFITAGSINRLVEEFAATCNLYSRFQTVFLSSCCCFETSQTIVSKFIEIYLHAKGEKALETKRLTIDAIRKFLDVSFDECSESVVLMLRNFLSTMEERSQERIELKAKLDKKIGERNRDIHNYLLPPIDFYLPEEMMSPITFLLMCDENQIAQQMTLVDYNMCCQLRHSEFYNQAWKRKGLEHRARNIRKCIDRIGEVSSWCASIVLMFPEMTNRAKMMLKFVNVAEKLMEMNNFMGLAGVIGGLESDQLARLTHTKECLPASAVKALSNMSKLVGKEGSSYKQYKVHIKKVTGPYVPLILELCEKMSGIEKKMQSVVEKDTKQMYNFAKWDSIYEKVEVFFQFKKTHYFFTATEPLYSYLTQVASVPTDLQRQVSSMYQR